jgi:hypothetical protein
MPRALFLGWCLLIAIVHVGASRAGEIGVPLSDPKFPISIFAHEGTKTVIGEDTVYRLEGGCRIYQGTFIAEADRANLWIRTSAIDGQTLYRVILETEGSCSVRWADDQRLKDVRWMGRLFSHFETQISVDVWKESTAPPPALDWARELNQETLAEGSNAPSSAIHWTQEDEATHIRLATQLLQNVAPPSTANAAPQLLPPNGALPFPAAVPLPTGGNSAAANPFPNSMQIGNSQLGGTVLDAGSMPLFESVSPQQTPAQPPAENIPGGSRVEAFQLPAPGSMAAPPMAAPAPIAAPVAAGAPDVRPPMQRIGARTFAFSGRGGVEPQLQSISRPDRGDTVITISRGIRLMFGDAAVQTSGGLMDLGTILIEADRCVIWTSDMGRLLSKRIDDLPVELYLEGNIVFQQGARKIYADRMYYNVQSEYGMILGAEILTPAPQYEGIVRLKADVVQQRSRENFLATRAALTSSRLGIPRYWLQSDRIELNDERQSDKTGLLGFGILAPPGDQTGMKAKARNNFVYLGGVPVMYWPIMNSNVDTPSFYLNGLGMRKDSIFGSQVYVDWDLYQILGINAVDGTKWGLSTDYLEKRGFALGTNFNYNVPSFHGGGPTNGNLDVWGLQDRGLDTVGSDRFQMVPEATSRGHALLTHRQLLTPDKEFWAELGWISDRNFQEQFFERDWDTLKDSSTALRYRHYFASQQMLDFWGAAHINAFHTETQWLPRLDHYLLGQSIGDVATWYAHSNVGYAQQRVATTPTAPQDRAKFQLQAWEVNASGIQAITRQEIDLPFNTGHSKWTPYLAGEAAYWGEDINGQSLGRLTGQAGLRTALPVWKVYPDVQSSLFNLNGMAHKISFESDTWYADTTQSLSQLPLYDPIDDNSQEHFRRRLVFNTFSGSLPAQFDPRYFAARQGMQRYVSAASPQIVADQMQSRMGVHQRLQTKRGVPGRERIADVVEFDVDGIYFYNPDRDNFGQSVGGLNYDFKYHIGDRVTLMSDGYYDLFEQGLQATSIGAQISRPGRGDLYTAFTNMNGPFSSSLLSSTFNYRMNDKWAAYGGTSYDFGPSGNVGTAFGVTRIGESFLLQVGATYDRSRDNVSFQFALEPRFLPTRGMGVIGGQVIPPAGLYGLE